MCASVAKKRTGGKTAGVTGSALDGAADGVAAFVGAEAADVALRWRRSERDDIDAAYRLLFSRYVGGHFTAHQFGGDDAFDARDVGAFTA
jgi:hypothetical protein